MRLDALLVFVRWTYLARFRSDTAPEVLEVEPAPIPCDPPPSDATAEACHRLFDLMIR